MTATTIMGTERMGKLIVRLAVPSIVAQCVNILYNTVDRIYIGRIPDVGAMALTGLGLSMPVVLIVVAFALFVGMGGAPLAAIEMGKGDYDKAERILGGSVVLLIALSIVLTAVFLIWKRPLLYAFGASDNTIEYALEYITVYLYGTFAVQLTMGLNTYISAQGRAGVAMCSILFGAVLNIILDPLFIFVWRMGIGGAAWATVISQTVSAVWVVWFLCSNRSAIRIKPRNMRFDPRIVGAIAALGISPFIMRSTESFVQIALNAGLSHYGGDLYVGSMTILQSVMSMVFALMQGLTAGVQPIVSYNYGARNIGRVKQAFFYMLASLAVIGLCSSIATFFFPRALAELFTDEAALIDLSASVMPYFFGGVWMFAGQMSCQTVFLGLGYAKVSLFIASLRKIILLIPLSILLPMRWGVIGIYFAEPISDILAALTAVTLFSILFTRLVKRMNRQEADDAEMQRVGQ